MTDTPEEQTLLWSALCQSQRLELLVEKLNARPDTENLSTTGSEDLIDMARRDLAKVVICALGSATGDADCRGAACDGHYKLRFNLHGMSRLAANRVSV